MICQWIFHCERTAKYIVVLYGTEIPVCNPCVREYGLNDGDFYSISDEDDEE
jgi:hypothetical protein